MSNYQKSFIEVQFPISQLNHEAYKERMAGSGQTLTGLGKWWGRKPLILVRATILGLLLPATTVPKEDLRMFMKLMVMDDNGLWRRAGEPKKITREDFDKLSYKERINYNGSIRPEHIHNLSTEDWKEINLYYGTKANTFQEFFQEMGEKRYGKTPVVADVFCGGGSIPFEAARMGMEVHASDLNPVAGLLTWSALNILSLPDTEIKKLKDFQKKVYNEVKTEMDKLGWEKNSAGETADYYLYLNETKCPYCNTTVPLAPSFIISVKNKTIAELKYNPANNNYDITVKNNVSDGEMSAAKNGTVQKGSLHCPRCNNQTSISTIRGDKKDNDGKTVYGLRQWDITDIVAKTTDVFQERLYCIRWITKDGKKEYRTPTTEDFKREQDVLNYVQFNLTDWQAKGYTPTDKIITGEKTDELFRTRGWNYWHQLFNSRQLLLNALFLEKIEKIAQTKEEKVIGMLMVNRISDYNSKLSSWMPRDISAESKGGNTFVNQALNTMYNYPARTLSTVDDSKNISLKNFITNLNKKVNFYLKDARKSMENFNFIITDPPYADAVNYHELTEFFLAWDKHWIPKIFPEWYTDSKRSLAVKGTGDDFNKSMVEVYKNLTDHMDDDGYQVIYFTHQDTQVWADLTNILWASGLQVSQAWCISTETESGGLKSGNYVKGTVVLVLRKQTGNEVIFEYEINDLVEDAVKDRIDQMKKVDFHASFTDADYYLAAYAAALEVLTRYSKIEGIDVNYELTRVYGRGEKSKIAQILDNSRSTVAGYLVPQDISPMWWKKMSFAERFYVAGLNVERNSSNNLSTYQEISRTFNYKDYNSLLENTKANTARLRTACELGNDIISGDEFGKSLLRNVLNAVRLSAEDDNPLSGFNYLKTTYPYDFLDQRPWILEALKYLIILVDDLWYWERDSRYAKLLFEYTSNQGL